MRSYDVKTMSPALCVWAVVADLASMGSLTHLSRHSDLQSEHPVACLAGPSTGWVQGIKDDLRLEAGLPGEQLEWPASAELTHPAGQVLGKALPTYQPFISLHVAL